MNALEVAGAVDFPHLFLSALALLVVVGIGFIAAATAYGIGHKDGHRDGYIDGYRAAEKELAPPF